MAGSENISNANTAASDIGEQDRFMELQRPGEDPDEFIGRFLEDFRCLSVEGQRFMLDYGRALVAVKARTAEDRACVHAEFHARFLRITGRALM